MQWMLGDQLLIAPVTEEGATAWEVYLPEGAWVDVWTGEDVEGGRVIARDAPIDIIPVYCRRDVWPTMQAVFAP